MLKDNTTYITIFCEDEMQIDKIMHDISIEFGTDTHIMEVRGNELLLPIYKGGPKYNFSLNQLEEFVAPQIVNLFDVEYHEFVADGQHRLEPVRCWHRLSRK